MRRYINNIYTFRIKFLDHDNNIETILNNLSYRPVELFLPRIFYIILYYFSGNLIYQNDCRNIVELSSFDDIENTQHFSILIFNQTKNTPFSNSSIINILTRRRRRGGGGGIFVSHLENICLFPSTYLHLRLFQHSFVSQTLTNDRSDRGALVRIIEETHERINLTRTKKKEKRNKDSEKVEINRCTNSIWRARLVVISS